MLQTKIAVLLFSLDEYTALTELSLDVSGLADETLRTKYKDSIKPDICVYSQRSLDITEDVVKMTEMPLLAIETLSPMQGVKSLIEKVRVYFALGVRSSWIVYPYNRSVTVYTAPKSFSTYSTGNVVANILNFAYPMCCGIMQEELMVRVGPEQYAAALAEPHARKMDFTGRPIKRMI